MKPEGYFTWSDEIAASLKNIHADSKKRPRTILNLGDSISCSDCFVWHLRTRLSEPGMLSSEGYRYLPKNLGARGGMESSWGKQRVGKALSRGDPELATILFGTNDLQHGKRDPKRFRANMEAIVEACIGNKTVPILLKIPTARTIKDEVLDLFNREVDELAKAKKIPVIDTCTIFRKYGGWKALCFDGVHPNAKRDGTGGYDYINRTFFALYKRIEKEVFGRSVAERKPKLLGREDKDGVVIEAYDRNADGKPDFWLHKKGGEKIEERFDSDFDGRIEVTWRFKAGRLISGKEVHDGKTEVPFVMKDGWKNETP